MVSFSAFFCFKAKTFCSFFSSELHIPITLKRLHTNTHVLQSLYTQNHSLIMRRTHGNKLLGDNDATAASTRPSSMKRGEGEGAAGKRCVPLYENPMQISFHPRGT